MSATTSKPVWSPEAGPDHLPVHDLGTTAGLADGGVDEAGGAGAFLETDAVGPGVETSAPEFLPALLLRTTTAVIATDMASTTAAARPITTVRRLPNRGSRAPAGGRRTPGWSVDIAAGACGGPSGPSGPGGGCGSGGGAVGASRVSSRWIGRRAGGSAGTVGAGRGSRTVVAS